MCIRDSLIIIILGHINLEPFKLSGKIPWYGLEGPELQEDLPMNRKFLVLAAVLLALAGTAFAQTTATKFFVAHQGGYIGEATVTIDGAEFPLVKVDVSSSSHPFYTGTMRILDTAGRVEKFGQKYGKGGVTSKLLKKK